MTRPDHLTSVRLAALRDLTDDELWRAFSQPDSAIATLTADLTALWDDHRTDCFDERRIGTLSLASGAYLQWIGYGPGLGVECSSNAFLSSPGRLTAVEEDTLVRAGFHPPDDETPNHWIEVHDRDECGGAAFSVVAVLTALFGVYAG